MLALQPASARLTRAALALAASVGLAVPAAAQTFTWNGSGTNPPWGTAANWNPTTGAPPNSSTAVATFSGTGTSAVNVDAAFTVGTLQFTTAAGPGGGYTLGGAGSLSIGGASPTLANSVGNNAINIPLSATNLAVTINSGTLTLGNTSATRPNSLAGATIAVAGGALSAVVAGTVGIGDVNNPTAVSTGSNSLGAAAIALSGGTLNLQGAVVTRPGTNVGINGSAGPAGGLTGQFFNLASVANVTAMINNNGLVGFNTGRADFFVRNYFDQNGTVDRARANAFLNSQPPATLGSSGLNVAPAGVTVVNSGQTSALTPPSDSAANIFNTFYFGGLSFPNIGTNNLPIGNVSGMVFGQGSATAPNQTGVQPTNLVNVGQYATFNHLARFSGLLNITSGGAYTFDTSSDDASLVYIDGHLIVNNNADQGVAGFLNGRFGPPNFNTNPSFQRTDYNLSAGPHTIDVLYQQGGGGAGLIVNYSGNDTFGTEVPIPATALSGFQAQVALNNAVSLAAGTTSTINASRAFEMQLGALTFGAGATLNTNTSNPSDPGNVGGFSLIRFNGGTTLAGATAGGTNYTVNVGGDNDLALGVLSNPTAGSVANLVKQGSQNLILDGGNPTLTGTINFNIQNGRVVAVARQTSATANSNTNALGAGSIINLIGAGDGTATLQLRPQNEGAFQNTSVLFNNTLNVSQNGIVEVVPYLQQQFNNVQLIGNNTTPATVTNASVTTVNFGASAANNLNFTAAGKSLIVDVYGSATWIVLGNITGTGTILKGDNPTTVSPPSGAVTQVPPVNNGVGIMQLNGSSAGALNWVINYGTVSANNVAAFGPSSGSIVVNQFTYSSLDPNLGVVNATTGNSGGTLGLQGGLTFTNQPPTTLNGTGAPGRSGAIDVLSNNTNSYSTVDGLITLGSSTTLGPGTGTLNINSALRDTAPATPITITKGGGGTLFLNVAANTLTNGTNLTVTGGTLNIPVAGAVGNVGTLTVSGGTLFSNAANGVVGALGTTTSPVTINQTGGTINANVTGNIGTQAVTTISGGNFNVNASQQVASLAGGPGGQIVNLNNNSVLTVGTASNLSGTYNGIVNGNGSIVKNGTGTLGLGGGNGFSGGVRVNAGTLVAASVTAMGSGTATLAGGTLNVGNVPATGIPLAATGWNHDTIRGLADVNPTAANGFGTTTGVDNNSANGGFGFYEQGINLANPTVGLPTGTRTVTSITNPSVNFTFQPYNVNNTLYLTNTNGLSSTLTLTTPQSFGFLNILHTTGSGSSTYNVFLNFTDSTTSQVGTNVASPDWFNNTPFALAGFDRYQRNNGAFAGVQGQPNPRLYEFDITLSAADATKVVQSITITRTNANGFLNIYAVSGGNVTTNSTYANSIVALAGTTSNITESILTTNPATVTMGALTLQAGSVLNVAAAATAPANVAYTLNFGATTLAGAATMSVANNGTAVGTVTFGPLSDGGVGQQLTKAGTGTLTLTSPAAQITSGTQVNVTAGTLNVNGAGALGTLANVTTAAGATVNLGASQTFGGLNGTGGTVNLNANTLTVGSTNNLPSSYGGSITGAGALVKAGTGILALSGTTNNYLGGTTVNAGTLLASNGTTGLATGTGTVVVNNGGTLGGNGTVGPTRINSGGTISPGTSIGNLHVGNSVWNPGGTYAFEYNPATATPAAGTDNDTLTGTTGATLDLTNLTTGSFTFAVAPSLPAGTPVTTPVTYTAATFPGGITGFNPNEFIFIGLFAGSPVAGIAGGNTILTLTFTPVPEPAHLLAMCGGAAGAVGWWRRRRARG